MVCPSNMPPEVNLSDSPPAEIHANDGASAGVETDCATADPLTYAVHPVEAFQVTAVVNNPAAA